MDGTEVKDFVYIDGTGEEPYDMSKLPR